MNRQRLLFASLVLIIALFTLTSCANLSVRYPVKAKGGYGPPPHAPAHGYRHKHPQGHEIVYDSGLGVYVVVDLDDYYYHENRYYRLDRDRWEMSVHIRGPWEAVVVASLPAGLQKNTHCKGKCKKHRHRGCRSAKKHR